MSYGIDKVIQELKGRSAGKFDIDKIQKMVHDFKHPAAPEEGVAVVEIEAVPEVEVEEVEECPTEEVKEDAEAETPELPESEEVSEDVVEEDETTEKEEEKPASDGSENENELDTPSPEEKSKMDEVISAIKTFFPNEDTEDVLVRIVSKLIDK